MCELEACGWIFLIFQKNEWKCIDWGSRSVITKKGPAVHLSSDAGLWRLNTGRAVAFVVKNEEVGRMEEWKDKHQRGRTRRCNVLLRGQQGKIKGLKGDTWRFIAWEIPGNLLRHKHSEPTSPSLKSTTRIKNKQHQIEWNLNAHNTATEQ